MNFWLPFLVLFYGFGLPLEAREPTSRDYAVWSSLIMPRLAEGYTYVWHQVEPASVFARGLDRNVLDYFPDATFVQRAWAEESAELNAEDIIAGLPVRLLFKKDLRRIVGRTPKASWAISPSLIVGAGAIYRLSWPAYSEDGRKAYVVIGDFNYWQGLIVIERLEKDKEGTWQHIRDITQSVSCWGPGWPPPVRESRLFIEE